MYVYGIMSVPYVVYGDTVSAAALSLHGQYTVFAVGEQPYGLFICQQAILPAYIVVVVCHLGTWHVYWPTLRKPRSNSLTDMRFLPAI